MAMTYVQTQICTEVQTIAEELLSIRGRLTTITEMYGNENIVALDDDAFAAVPRFAHITAAEFGAAAGALVAINTALGTGAGSNSAKLLKIAQKVPR